ncbi:MAG: hypothetical protein ACPG32_08435 [Akkermansiaceae bacterium]
MKTEFLTILVILAGVGQLVLVLASAAIPACLNWGKHLITLPKLMRQLFWTYGCYILAMHLFFGIISTWGYGLLLDGSPHAAILCALMAAWWLVRISLQLFCFDRKGIPKTPFNTLAEVGLMVLFIYLATTYSLAVYHNLRL